MKLFSIAGMLIATGAAYLSQPGTFALQGGTVKTAAYLVDTELGSSLSRRLDVWMTSRGVTVTAYQSDNTKLLHAILISDDFRTFVHEHPAKRGDGHFVWPQMLPTGGAYYLYVDGSPQEYGQQVFRFDLFEAGLRASRPRDLSETRPVAAVDGYTVALSTLRLKAGGESLVEVHIAKGGKPATDLHPYLGALAHAVFIDAGDLSYLHVHPMPPGSDDDMSDMGAMHGMTGMSPPPSDSASEGADMALHVRVLKAGTYKLWLEFNGGGSLHVAPFVLTAR